MTALSLFIKNTWVQFFQGLTVLCWGLLGCASGPQTAGEAANYGIKDGRVWARGPWDAIKPSQDIAEVIDQLCPAIMRLPRAQLDDNGREYCGLIYTLGDGASYASHPSPLSDTKKIISSSEKNCMVPRWVEDSRGQTEILADYHSHPWEGSSMITSRLDRVGATQLFSLRIQFDTTCRIQKLNPYLKEERPGELYERRGKKWQLIALIKPEHKATGRLTLVDN